MQPLYQDQGFTFRFADDRRIPRIHLEGVPAGRCVAVYQIDPATGARRHLLAKASVGSGGWVDLAPPLVVRAGECFIAVPEHLEQAAPLTSLLIRTETAADHDSIREVNQRAFHHDAEGRLVDALRQGGYVRLSLVAEYAGRVVGHILFSHSPIITANGSVPALALAPTAVLPELQKRGVGSALVRRGLEDCRAHGQRIVVVLGHPHFYPRFGFSTALAQTLDTPYRGEAFMAVELIPGALAGVAGRVQYAPAFAEL